MIHEPGGLEDGPRVLETKGTFEMASVKATSRQWIDGSARWVKPALAQ